MNILNSPHCRLGGEDDDSDCFIHILAVAESHRYKTIILEGILSIEIENLASYSKESPCLCFRG